jgi:hypothetical protein
LQRTGAQLTQALLTVRRRNRISWWKPGTG